VELKRNDVDVQDAYTDNYTDYLDTIPHLFYYNAFLMLSNGTEAKVGTLGSKYEFFHEWKRLAEEDEGSVALETMLLGICKKENFLDLLENFILFDHSNGHTAKILARNHQYIGVNEAVKAYSDRKLNDGNQYFYISSEDIRVCLHEIQRHCISHTQNAPVQLRTGASFTLFTQHQDKPLRSSLSIGFAGDRHPVLFSSFSPFRM
jgi:hypothetical protein